MPWQTGLMVRLLLDSAELEVSLSAAERALAFRRESVRVRRSDITKVQLSDDPWTWVRGVRKPGTWIPGVVAAGTWHSTGGSDFVLVRRGRPGVVVDLAPGADFRRLVLTTTRAADFVRALNVEVSTSLPTDVIDIVAQTKKR